MSWVKRVEAVLDVLKGSNIGEIELAEGELEIIIRRSPGKSVSGHAQRLSGSSPSEFIALANRSIEMKSPLTGVYYSTPSPTSPPFIQVGDSINVGQFIALIEAMKVFSEIPSEVAGRVVSIKIQSGEVVKKGDVLFTVEIV